MNTVLIERYSCDLRPAQAERKPTGNRRLVELDVLRFAAAVSVMLYHHVHWSKHFRGTEVYSLTRYGDLGVPLFFMISGFVILWSAQGKSLGDFAASRALRLYPTFWLCLIAATFADVFLGGHQSIGRFLANFTMAPELFHEPATDVVYWTLLVELKFYLGIALLILSHQLKRIELWLLIWLMSDFVAFIFHAQSIEHYALLPWAPYFIAGAALYIVWTRGALVLPTALVGACAIFSFLSTWQDDHSAARAGVILAIYAAMTTLALRWWRLPQWKVWGILGGMTYPLYLLHSRPTKALWSILHFGPVVNLMLTILAALAAALAIATLAESRTAQRVLHKRPAGSSTQVAAKVRRAGPLRRNHSTVAPSL